MAISHKVFSSRALNVNSATYVGEAGRLFYEQTTGTGIAPVLKYSDGVTPGGLPLSGSSLTFSSNTPPLNPTDGILWWNTNDGRLYIYYDNSWVDASPDVQGAVTEIIAGPGISINTSTGAVTITATGGNGNGYTGSAGTNGTNGYVGSQGTNGYTGSAGTNGINGYTGSQGIPTDLTGYATETWVNNHNYLQVETGVHSVTGTANQVIVTDLGNRDIQLSTPQNLNSTATVIFGNLTVNNLNVLNTLTSVVPNVVEGYRLYLASTSTQDTQIDGGGIVLGTSTWQTSLLYNLSVNQWQTSDDTGLQVEHLIAARTTVSNLTVLTGASIGYSNLQGEFSNALLQIDAASDTYSQVNFQNHSSSTYASGDYVVTNDIGTDGKHFIDMGINSSRYSTSSWVINGANDGYLYIDSGNLAIGTTATEIVTFIGPTDTTDSIISVANATTITYSVDLMPSIDAQYLLGRPGLRWKGGYFGTGSVWIQDVSLGTDAELTVDNGVLFVNGISGLRVGNIQITPTGLTTYIGSQNITLGAPGDTGYVQVNRGVQYLNGQLQTVAWNSTATVLWSQITGAPNVTGYTGSAGTNGATGFTGSAGTNGTNGFTGSAGTNGTNGYTGSAGTNGATGFTGSAGTNGTNGYTGSAGTNGTNGYTGSFGITGYTGSASTVSGPQGYSGSVGLTGYTGSVPGPYVSSITAGTGTYISTSTGAVTIWAIPNEISSTGSTTASNYTIDMSGPSFVHWQPTANGNRTITLSNFTPGRKVEVFITPHSTNDVFTVSGVTASQCSNGVNTFTINGVGASAQNSFMLQIYCTTNAVGGVWIFGSSCV